MATSNKQYWKVVAKEGEAAADLYLYGYIGQDTRWWGDEYKEETLTDLEVVRKLRELEENYSRINIRINSPGGSVMHGDPMITAIRNSPAEIHTYVDGMAASMAADIWAAGKVRHMGMNAKLMIHSISTVAAGNAMQMLEVADRLDKMDEIAINSFAADTNMSPDEVRARFYDYKDHWLSAEDALELGFIGQIEDYPTQELPAEPEKMAYADLVKAYQPQQQTATDAPTFWDRAGALLQRLTQKRATPPDPAPEDFNKTRLEMNLEDFKASLGEELAESAVVEAMEARGYTVTKAAADPAPENTPDVVALLKEVVDPLQAQIKELQAQVKAYGDLPGAAPADTASTTDAPDGLNTGTDTYDAIKALADKASKGERVDTSGRL